MFDANGGTRRGGAFWRTLGRSAIFLAAMGSAVAPRTAAAGPARRLLGRLRGAIPAYNPPADVVLPPLPPPQYGYPAPQAPDAAAPGPLTLPAAAAPGLPAASPPVSPPLPVAAAPSAAAPVASAPALPVAPAPSQSTASAPAAAPPPDAAVVLGPSRGVGSPDLPPDDVPIGSHAPSADPGSGSKGIPLTIPDLVSEPVPYTWTPEARAIQAQIDEIRARNTDLKREASTARERFLEELKSVSLDRISSDDLKRLERKAREAGTIDEMITKNENEISDLVTKKMKAQNDHETRGAATDPTPGEDPGGN